MPLTSGRRRIRFRNQAQMTQAIERDAPYQYRHLFLLYLLKQEYPVTMKKISEETGVSINVIPKVISALLKESLITDVGKIECQVTGNDSRGFVVNDLSNAPYL